MYVKIEGEKENFDIFKTYVETSHLDGKKIDHPALKCVKTISS